MEDTEQQLQVCGTCFQIFDSEDLLTIHCKEECNKNVIPTKIRNNNVEGVDVMHSGEKSHTCVACF